jgi:hypothetical protein
LKDSKEKMNLNEQKTQVAVIPGRVAVDGQMLMLAQPAK